MNQLPDVDFDDQSQLEDIAREHYTEELAGKGVKGGRGSRLAVPSFPSWAS